MTDKQKGLIPAVQQVFPDSEHRFCVRHLYSNFQMHFKGENLKNQLWACARSSNVVQWNKNMEMMRELDSAGHKWLQQMPPQTWVRAFFSAGQASAGQEYADSALPDEEITHDEPIIS